MSRSAWALSVILMALLAGGPLVCGAPGAGPRLRRAPPERVDPVVAPARGASGAELIEPEEVELIEPIAGADALAGVTIRNREAAMRLIQARGKQVPKVGQAAPDFELKTADGRETLRLSSFRAQKPVVLIFGSHT